MTKPSSSGAKPHATLRPEWTGDTAVLRRAEPLHAFPMAERPCAPFMRVALVDVETTGTDPEVDEVIDMAVALVRIDTFGQVVHVIDAVESLRDPGRPIPEIVTAITGITDDDVAGAEFDEEPFIGLLSAADICIAHHAAFDAAFVERLIPSLRGLPWACSLREFDWVRAGFDGAKLGHLLMQMGKFGDAHRAMSDVTNLLHVLTFSDGSNETILKRVIDIAMRTTMRVEATGAPFEQRHLLKASGYRWDPLRKVWWIEVALGEEELEEAWLVKHVLPPRRGPYMRSITCTERHR